MRIHAIILGALLAAGCSAPDNDAANAPVADSPDRTPSTPQGPAPISEDNDDTRVVPARFQGDYASDAPACSAPAHESRLTIGASRIEFHESAGTIVAVEVGGDGSIAITAELTGEGETRQATYHFNLSDDGQTLTDTDYGMARRRC